MKYSGSDPIYRYDTPSGPKYSSLGASSKIFQGEFQNWKKVHRPFLYGKGTFYIYNECLIVASSKVVLIE